MISMLSNPGVNFVCRAQFAVISWLVWFWSRSVLTHPAPRGENSSGEKQSNLVLRSPHSGVWADASDSVSALKQEVCPPALQSYCVAVCYVHTCACVCVWVQPGSFLTAWVTRRSVETSAHTPRRRQWCSWAISAPPALLPLIAARTPEMMQQTSPSTNKDGTVSADLPGMHHRPPVVLWLDSSESSHTWFKLSPLHFVFPSRHWEARDEEVQQHSSLREHVCGGNQDLRQSLNLKPPKTLEPISNHTSWIL